MELTPIDVPPLATSLGVALARLGCKASFSTGDHGEWYVIAEVPEARELRITTSQDKAEICVDQKCEKIDRELTMKREQIVNKIQSIAILYEPLRIVVRVVLAS